MALFLPRATGRLKTAVIGAPDPYWVEKVHPVVALGEGASVTADELFAFCKKSLAGYKVPKSVDFVASLPENETGKILKREVVVRLGKASLRTSTEI